jgi:arabinan endo-1,5-alpha-L-arabinosidase
MPRFTYTEWLRLLTASVIVALVAALVAATAVTTIRPAIPRDFPDPSILKDGDSYYAYSTESGYGNSFWHVPVQRADHPAEEWSAVADALPDVPGWVARDAHGRANVTAPDVSRRGAGGYLLYFVARAVAPNVLCVGAALADAPTGPFRPLANPLICQQGRVDSIDPQAFTDTDGTHYLLYTSGERDASIWLQRVAEDGTTLIGERRALIQADRPEEAHIVEAPSLVKHGSEYVLFYSGNAFNSGHYFVNYATAPALSGSFVKHPGELLNRDSLGDVYANPGGQSVLHDDVADYIFFHASTGPGQRAMFVAGLSWTSAGEPLVQLSGAAGAASRPGV